MSEPTWAAICESESATVVDASKYCGPEISVIHSPIDDYYNYIGDVLRLGKEDDLKSSETLGRLLLLGQVAGVELYLRSILSKVVRVCPISRKHSADQLVAFGAVEFYGADEYEWALFDAASLAGVDEIKKKTQKLLGLELPRGTSVDAALLEFGKLCHLRHAAVHTRGLIGRGNASSLELSAGSRLAVQVDFAALQAAGAVCHSFVRSYNRYVFRKVVDRWIGDSRISGDWHADKQMFQPLFEMFHSRIDDCGPKNAYLAYKAIVRNLPLRVA